MSDNPLSQVGSWHHPFLVSLMIPGSRHNDDEASTVLFLVQKVFQVFTLMQILKKSKSVGITQI